MRDELVDQVAYIAWHELANPAKAIVLKFNGLNNTPMRNAPEPIEQAWAQLGGVVVNPYSEPWAWMNAGTRSFVDELIDAIQKRLGVAADFPVIATGGSMGGHAALAYAMYTRHRIAGVFCNCPVCDLPYHYTERPDLPRTMHHAYGSYGDIAEALKFHSPLHQTDLLPNVPYLIIHGCKDKAVNKVRHSDKLVAQMRQRGMNITYVESPDMEHCGPMTWQDMTTCKDFVANLITGK